MDAWRAIRNAQTIAAELVPYISSQYGASSDKGFAGVTMTCNESSTVFLDSTSLTLDHQIRLPKPDGEHGVFVWHELKDSTGPGHAAGVGTWTGVGWQELASHTCP